MNISTKQKGFAVLVAAGAVGLAGCSSSSSGGGPSAGGTDSAGAPTSAAAPRQDADGSASDTASTGSSTDAGMASGDAKAVGDAGADLARTTFPVTLERAQSIARSKLPDGTISKIGLEFDGKQSRWVWKVDTQKGTHQRELKLDAGTGKVVGGESDTESGKPRAVDPTKLTPQDAMQKATALVPGTVSEWALEYDDGVQRYKLDIRTHGSHTQDVVVPVDSGKATRK